MEEIIEKQRAFIEEGNTLNPMWRRAALQILANTLREMEGDLPSDMNGLLNYIKVNQHSLRRQARKDLFQAIFHKENPSIGGLVGGNVEQMEVSGSFTDTMSAVVSFISRGSTVVISESAADPDISEMVRKVIDATFTEDYVAVISLSALSTTEDTSS